MATTDIEIGISVESLSDHFLMSPNALHRGEGEYAGLTLHERGMLAALLTFRTGGSHQWVTSRAGINELAPELGRDKVSSILKGLREKRYLYTRRCNVGAGRFRWEWRVFMRARPEGFDPFTHTIDGSIGHGQAVNGSGQGKEGVSAGRTIDGSIGPNQPSLREVTPPRSTSRSTPPTPRTSPPAPPVEPPTATGGEGNTDEDKAIKAAIAHQPGWKPIAVRAALRQAIQSGRPADVAYRVIIDLARGDTYGPTTSGPQRLLANGPWWTPGAIFVPAPPKDTTAICERHTWQPTGPSGICPSCAGERHEQEAAHARLLAQQATPRDFSAPERARDLFAGIPALQRARARTAKATV